MILMLIIPLLFIVPWLFLYFMSGMYTSDKLDDMLDRGEITWVQHALLYEKLMRGEYKLYPKLIDQLINRSKDVNGS